jgi:putative cell wall-binding protein
VEVLMNRIARLLVVLVLLGNALVAATPSAVAAVPGVENLELAQSVSGPTPFDGGFAFFVDEAAQGGIDLNGDGDGTDTQVWHVYRPGIGVINLGLATTGTGSVVQEFGGGIVLWGDETVDGRDLNGDGDKADTAVVHVYSLTNGLVNLGLATGAPRAVFRVEDGFGFWVDEAAQGGIDLNGDGDGTDTQVWHVYQGNSVKNLQLAASPFLLARDRRFDGGFMFEVYEAWQGGTDLNGDLDSTDYVWHVFEYDSGNVTNLGIATPQPNALAIEGGVAFLADEAAQGGTDLNGDLDTTDFVWHVFLEASLTTSNLQLASTTVSATHAGDGFAFLVDEGSQGGTILNNDGDSTDDRVVHVYSVAGGVTNLEVALDGIQFLPITDGVAVQVSEVAQDAILNGDGDKSDTQVWHVWRQGVGLANLSLATDVNSGFAKAVGDGFAFFVDETQQAASSDLNNDGDYTDTRVVHLWTPTSGVANLALATSIGDLVVSGDAFGFTVYEGSQGATPLNGDADDNDSVWHVHEVGGSTTNLGLANGFPSARGTYGDGFAFTVGEAEQGAGSLNGDGDTTDTTVWHLYDPTNGVTNLGLASERIDGAMRIAEFAGGFGFTVEESLQDAGSLNGDGDATDIAVWHVLAAPNTVLRYAGANRYGTAADISANDFPVPSQVSTVFVAVGSNFPDALAGAAVAAKIGAPLLLVQTDSIPAETTDELNRLDPDKIVILGGNAVVSPQVETQLSTYATVERRAGANRYETAVSISQYGFPANGSADTVIVATGLGFADALAGGPAANALNGPVLLTDPNALPSTVATEITRLAPSRIVVVGGIAAVSSTVFDQLEALVANTVRVSGANRYETAIAISQDAFPGGRPRAYIATGLNFPDALAGAAAAGWYDSPILLVPGTSVPAGVEAEIGRLGSTTVIILGGTAVVTNGVQSDLEDLLGL